MGDTLKAIGERATELGTGGARKYMWAINEFDECIRLLVKLRTHMYQTDPLPWGTLKQVRPLRHSSTLTFRMQVDEATEIARKFRAEMIAANTKLLDLRVAMHGTTSERPMEDAKAILKTAVDHQEQILPLEIRSALEELAVQMHKVYGVVSQA